VHAHRPICDSLTVVPLDDDRDLFFEAIDARVSHRHGELARKRQAEMLVFRIPIEACCSGLQDVRRRAPPRGDILAKPRRRSATDVIARVHPNDVSDR
jgi:hypothetical protein